MKTRNSEKFFRWGLTAFLTVGAIIAFWLILSDISGFYGMVLDFIDIISPILYGCLFAYLMNPIMEASKRLLTKLFAKTKLKEKTANRISTISSIIISVVVLLAAIYALIALIVPNIIASITTLLEAERIESYYKTISSWVNRTFTDTQVEKWFNDNIEHILQTLKEKLMEIDITAFLSDITSSVYSVIHSIFNLCIGIIAAVYVLIYKRNLCSQAKKLTAAVFRPQMVNRLFEIARRTNRIFGNYIIGKLLDALIVGFITYFALLIMGMPYAPLIATIVGVTNIIPFFGPFLGAVPSALLLLIDKPINAVYFLIFILVLQMIDGNIIENRILGEKLGISDFWVLVSILIFGGIFGLGGMLLGVPIFAVLYSLIADAINKRLHKKRLPMDTDLYYDLRCVEELPMEPMQSHNRVPDEPPYAMGIEIDDEDFDDEY